MKKVEIMPIMLVLVFLFVMYQNFAASDKQGKLIFLVYNNCHGQEYTDAQRIFNSMSHNDLMLPFRHDDREEKIRKICDIPTTEDIMRKYE